MSITKEQEVMRNEFSILQIDFGQMEERAEKLRAKAISLKELDCVRLRGKPCKRISSTVRSKLWLLSGSLTSERRL